MEFFYIVDSPSTEEKIRTKLSLKNLNQFSDQMFLLDQPMAKDLAQIGSVWGTFNLRRDEIKGGLRFALEECPNALCWTVTTGYPPAPDSMVLHLTINRKEIAQDFQEEIEEFLENHAALLKDGFEK